MMEVPQTVKVHLWASLVIANQSQILGPTALPILSNMTGSGCLQPIVHSGDSN